MSSPAGNHYSTVGDFLKLADALLTHRLLDSARSSAVLGMRYASGTDFRANGGGPGVNAEFSIFPSGYAVVVLSNYDPPAATSVAEHVRSLLVASSPENVPQRPLAALSGQQAPAGLRQEIDGLLAAMVAALKADPARVAGFYTDDASILGGGSRYVGRAEVDQYWREATMFADWTLEVIEVGGEPKAPWVRGRSTLVGNSGRRMATEFIGLLKRQPDGRLKFYVDMFVAASPGMRRPGG
jgi:ketosteroid isomerase-like protein